MSGFHSLVGSGTTAKQLDHERDAKPIAYGGMLIECALALISLCAVGFIWSRVCLDGDHRTPTAGVRHRASPAWSPPSPAWLAHRRTVSFPAGADRVRVLPDLSGHRHPSGPVHVPGVLAGARPRPIRMPPASRPSCTNPCVATVITVVLGVALGMTGYSKIWPLFGAANQLLAALALLAVCCLAGQHRPQQQDVLLSPWSSC
ncbi:MAG: carbon starvation CstA family protein [Vescimonas sp.]